MECHRVDECGVSSTANPLKGSPLGSAAASLRAMLQTHRDGRVGALCEDAPVGIRPDVGASGESISEK